MSNYPPPPPPPPLPGQEVRPPPQTIGERFKRQAQKSKDPTHTLIMIAFLLAFGILAMQLGRLQVTVIDQSPDFIDAVTLFFGDDVRHAGALSPGERFNTSFEGGLTGELRVRVFREGEGEQSLSQMLGEDDTGYATSRAFFITPEGKLVEGVCGLLCRFDFGEPELPSGS